MKKVLLSTILLLTTISTYSMKRTGTYFAKKTAQTTNPLVSKWAKRGLVGLGITTIGAAELYSQNKINNLQSELSETKNALANHMVHQKLQLNSQNDPEAKKLINSIQRLQKDIEEYKINRAFSIDFR